MATATYNVHEDIFNWLLVNAKSRLTNEWVAKIDKWKNTDKNPTINQLQQLSQKTDVPFGYFFLEKIPKAELPMLNFRTVANSKMEKPSNELRDTINEMEARVSWLSDYRINQEFDPIPFVGAEKKQRNTTEKEKAINILDYFGLEPGWNYKKSENMFNYLRTVIMSYGITVCINGVVANTRRHLDQREFRAFVLINSMAPLIFINSNDSFNAKLFSLVHELVHIWYNQPELYNDDYEVGTKYNKKLVSEHEINTVVAEILLPKLLFLNDWKRLVAKNDLDKIFSLARNFSVSALTVAIRAKELCLIDQSIVENVKVIMIEQYKESKKKQKETTGGPSFYKILAYKTDFDFAMDVFRSTANGDTSYTQAFDLLNVKGTDGFNALKNKLEKGRHE